MEQEQSAIESKQEVNSNIQIGNIKQTVLQGKVPDSEAQHQTRETDEALKIRRLMFRQKTGATLTVEEQELIQQHVRQTNEAQVRFRNQQNQKKNKGISI